MKASRLSPKLSRPKWQAEPTGAICCPRHRRRGQKIWSRRRQPALRQPCSHPIGELTRCAALRRVPQDNLNITVTKATAPIRAKATAMARAGLLTGKFGVIARR